MPPHIMFSCSMRGSHAQVSTEELRHVKEWLKELGLELVSEHQTREGVIEEENQETPTHIHDRDYQFIAEADAVVAEISNPSLGVGGEISDAIHLEKPVIAVYQPRADQVSAYTRGKLDSYEYGRHVRYTSREELKDGVATFLDEQNIGE